MTLTKKLLQLKTKKYTYFTTPSHSQNMPFKSLLGKNYYNIDMSEVDGLDNLNYPQECILETEEELQHIYNSSYTHMLTNGSSQGMLALMLAVLRKRDKVLVAVNCHKCVHNGLVLTGAEPIWLYPNYDTDYGVYSFLSVKAVEEAIINNSSAKCLIITNPTYDGFISDVSKISEICKEHGVTLIVDEAHGGLWNFDTTIGTPAILCGADASVQSLHKTCGAVNPAGLLHLSKDTSINKEQLLDAINLISTTSPSYPIMVNIEETTQFLNSKKGKNCIEKLLNNISDLTNALKTLKNIEYCHFSNDITKLFIKPLKISASEASDILYEKFKIECEIQHANALTFIFGIGTTEKSLKKLKKALKYLDKISDNNEFVTVNKNIPPQKGVAYSPQQAYYSESEYVRLEDAIGRICSQIVTSYPPGIPLLTYGERIYTTHLNFLDKNFKIRIVK